MVFDSIHIMKEFNVSETRFFLMLLFNFGKCLNHKTILQTADEVRNYWKSKKVMFCFGFVKIFLSVALLFNFINVILPRCSIEDFFRIL